MPICNIPQDCLLFLNTWVNGVAGFIHTQIGLCNPYLLSRSSGSSGSGSGLVVVVVVVLD